MKKKSLIFICLILFIVSIAGVSATEDTNQTLDDTSDLLQADVVPVSAENGTFSDLQTMIDGADSGSVINLETDYVYDGEIDSGQINVNKDLTINGNGHVIDANNRVRIMYIWGYDVILNNITFINGYVTDWNNGGAIYFYGSHLSISDCVFEENYAGDNGGAIRIGQGTVDIYNSTFIGNFADDGGGTIYGDRINIYNSTFEDNYAGYAGSIYADVINCVDSTFIYNGAWQYAGVMVGNSINVSRSKFINNSADDDWGVIYAYRSLDVDNCIFEENYGGSVAVFATDNFEGAQITNCEFINNTADDDILIRCNVMSVIENCTFEGMSNIDFMKNYYNLEFYVFGDEFTYPDSVPVTFYMYTDVNTTCEIWLDDDLYENLTISSSGNYSFVLENLYPGSYEIEVLINGTDYYYEYSEYDTFEVRKISPELNIDVDNILYGEDLFIDIYMNCNVTDSAYVYINPNYYNITLVNGKAQLKVSDLAAGSYEVIAAYVGNEIYENAEASAFFTVLGLDEIKIIAEDIFEGEDLIINILVNGNGASEAFVDIGGVEYRVMVVDNNAQLAVSNLTIGTYAVVATCYYDNVSVHDSCNVSVMEYVYTFTEIQEIIDNAVAGSTIELDHDVAFDENVDSKCININKQLTINGNGHTIDANKKVRIMNVYADDVVLNDITFIKGYSNRGGAIYFTGSNLSLNGCNFADNYVYDDGGAIFASGTVSINNSSFISNSASDDGGTIYSSGSQVNIVNSLFMNNSGNYWGNIYASTINCADSTFINNYARVSGGALNANYVNISNSNFINNSAGSGGAIIAKSSLAVDNCVFADNRADNVAAIQCSNNFDNVAITNSAFINNTAGDDNLIRCSIASVIENCTFEGLSNIYYIKKSYDWSFYMSEYEFTYPDSVTVSLYMYNDVNTTAALYIDDEFYKNITVNSSGDYSFVLDDLYPGGHQIKAVLNETDYYSQVSRTLYVTVNKIDTQINVNTQNITYGEDLFIDIYMNCNVSDFVSVSVNDRYYNVSLVNGKSNLTISGLGAGLYDIYVSYDGDDIYASSDDSVSVRVMEPGTIYVSADDIFIGEDLTVNVLIGGNVTGEAKVYINGLEYSVEIIDNEGVVVISGLDIGEYEVIAKYLINGNVTSQDSCNVEVADYIYPFRDLQILINKARRGRTLNLIHNYAYDGTTLSISKPITINGNGHFLDGDNDGRIMSVSGNNVVLNNIVFKNGYSNAGSAISYTGNHISISDCSFENNYAYDDGGAIYAVNGIVEIYNSDFIANTADDDGASIYSSNVKIYNSTFVDNYGNYWGNVYAGSSILCVNSTFINNYARGGGGAIYYRNNIDVINSSFVNNSPDTFNSNPTFKAYLTVDFNSNPVFTWDILTIDVYTSYGATGSVIVTIDDDEYDLELVDYHAQLNVSDLTVGTHKVTVVYSGNGIYKSNSEEYDINVIGDGLYVFAKDTEYGYDLVIDVYVGANATGNVSILIDGKEYIVALNDIHAQVTVPDLEIGDYDITVNWNNLTNHTSVKVFEHVYTFTEFQKIINNAESGSVIELDHDVVFNKKVDSNSININKDITINGNGRIIDGANQVRIMYINGNDVVLNNISFINGSTADWNSGGAIYFNGNHISINDCLFEDNYARDDGGAICSSGGTIDINNSVFIANSAGDDGGVIYCSNVNIYNSTFMDNSANYWGNVYAGSSIVCVDSTFINNHAIEGGAIYQGGSIDVINSSFVDNTPNDIRDNPTFRSYLSVDLSSKVINVGDMVTIDAYTNYGATGQVTITIDGKNYYLGLVDYHAQLNVTGLTAGAHEVTTTYSGNNVYKTSTVESVINVIGDEGIFVFAENIEYGNDLVIDVYIGGSAAGNVSVFFGESVYVIALNDSHAQLAISGVEPGDYIISAVYGNVSNMTSVSVIEHIYTFTEFQEMINKAEAGSTIELDHNVVFDESIDSGAITVNKAITINGNGHTFDGKDKVRIMYVPAKNVVLNDITFINGRSGDGGAIYSTNNLEINDCIFINNSASTDGGAIYCNNKCSVNNSYFENNVAYYSGGAIRSWDGTVEVINSTFINCKSTSGNGGAINSRSADLVVINSHFEDNVARYNGGAIRLDNVNSEIVNSTFTSNVAGDGGAINTYESTLAVANSSFIGNDDNDNYAIYSHVSAVTLDNCTFIGNKNISNNKNTLDMYLYYNSEYTYPDSVSIDIETYNDDTVDLAVYVNNVFDRVIKLSWGTTLVLNNLTPDSYEVSFVLNETNRYYAKTATASFVVNKKQPSLNVTAEDIMFGSDFIVDVALSESVNETVFVFIDFFAYSVSLSDGKGQLNVSDLAVGSYDVSVFYNGSDLYESVGYSSSFEVLGLDEIKVSAEDIVEVESLIINVLANGNKTNEVFIDVDGKKYAVNVSDNKAQLIISDLGVGTYEVVASCTYGNETVYDSCNVTVKEFTYSFTELQEMINNAASGSTIVLDYSVVFNENVDSNSINLNKAITIDGNGYTIDGNGKVRIMNIGGSNPTLINTVFINGYADGDGGAIYGDGFTLVNCSFINNFATGDGGAIHNNWDGFALVNCTFINNTADNGGAIYNNWADFTVDDCTFINNTAYAYYGAGAIASVWGEFDIADSDFINNTPRNVSPEGSVTSSVTVDFNSILVSVEDSLIIDVYTNYGASGSVDVTIGDVTYTSDLVDYHAQFNISGLSVGQYTVTADYSGNDIYAGSTAESEINVISSDSLYIITNDVMYGNDLVIDVYVGGSPTGNVSVVFNGRTYIIPLSSYHAQLTISDAEVGDYNISARFGEIENRTSVSVTEFLYTFTDLQEMIDNAIIGSTIVLDHSVAFDESVDSRSINVNKPITIDGNGYRIDANGKARIMNINSEGVYLNNITFVNGDSENGGAVYANNALSVSDCIFRYNNAEWAGGAIYANNGLDITGSTFEHNSARENGGAIYVRNSYINAADSNFTDNSVYWGGAAIHSVVSYVTLDNCTFEGNDNVSYEKYSVYYSISNDESVYDYPSNITVVVRNNNDFTLDLKIYVNGEFYQNISIKNDRIQSISLNDLIPGRYTVSAVFEGTDIYYGATRSCSFTINKLPSAMNITLSNTTVLAGDILTVDVVLSDNITGNVSINIGSNDYVAYVTDGYGQLNISDIFIGTYAVTAIYQGNEIYEGCSAESEITVIGSDAIYIITKDIFEIEDLVINVYVGFAPAGNLTVIFDDKEYVVEFTNYHTQLVFSDVEVGEYNITARYGEIENTTSVRVNEYFYTFTELQEMIDNAEPGSVIELNHHTIFNESVDSSSININKAITINGNGHIIFANDTLRIMNVNAEDVVLIDTGFAGGYSYRGGAIYANNALTINNCMFMLNTANMDGGAIYANNGLNITDSIFIANTASNNGESIYVRDSYINVENSQFTSISAQMGGAAIHSLASLVNVENCTFDNCENVSYEKYHVYYDIYTDGWEYYYDYPSNVTVIVNNEDLYIDLTLYVDNEYYDEISLAPWEEYYINLDNLIPGTYSVSAVFEETFKYYGVNETCMFVINKVTPTVEIILSNSTITAGDVLTIDVIVSDNATGNATVIIDSDEYIVEIVDGYGQLNVSNLFAADDYEINAYYNGDAIHDIAETQADVTVEKITNGLYVFASDITFGDTLAIHIYSNATSVGLTINGDNYGSVWMDEGYACKYLYDLPARTYTIVVSDGEASNSTTATVNKRIPSIIVDAGDVRVGEDVVVYIYLDDLATGQIVVFAGESLYPANLTDGEATVTISDLAVGEYCLGILYVGDENNYNSTAEYIVNVLKWEPYIYNVYSPQCTYGENLTLSFDIDSDATGNMTITIEGNEYIVNINNGHGSVDIAGLDAGEYLVDLSYSGDAKYYSHDFDTYVYVDKKVTYINATADDIVFGENLIVNIQLSEALSETVTLTVDGVTYNVKLTDGIAQKSIPNVNAGEQFIEVSYAGNKNFEESATISHVDVSKAQATLNVTVGDIVYGDDLIVNVQTSELATGAVNVTVGGKTYTVRLNNGKGSLRVSGLRADNYFVEASYPGDGNFIGTNRTVPVKVDKRTPSIRISTSDVTYGDNLIAEIILDEAISENVTFDLNGNSDSAKLTAGHAILTFDNLAADEYLLKVYYAGNENLTDAFANATATVNKLKTTLDISAYDIVYGEDLTVNIILGNGSAVANRATGTVTFNVSDVTKSTQISGASASAVFSGLEPDTYTITVSYSGDQNFTDLTAQASITVKKWNSSVSFTTEDIFYGEDLIVNVTSGVSEGEVKVTVDGKEITANLTGGHALITVPNVNGGNQTILVTYLENNHYYSSDATGYVTVKKINSTMSVTTSDITYGEDVVLHIDLTEGATGEILVSYDGINQTFAVSNVIRLRGVNAGNHTIEVTYLGDRNYYDSQDDCSVFVNKKQVPITVVCEDITYGDELNITVAVDATGNVTLIIDNRTMTLDVKDGKVNFAVDGLNAGNYSFIVNYGGDVNYFSNNTVSKVHVDKRETIINVNAGNITYGDHYNLTMNINATGNVSVSINNVTYEVEVINNYAVVPVPVLNAGNYTVIVNYLGSVNYYSNDTITYIYIDKKKTIINVEAENITYGDSVNITYNIQAEGTVNITMNNVTYKVRIINNQAVLPVGVLNAGNYTVIINYYGDINYYSNRNITYIYIDKSQTVINVKADNIVFGDKKNMVININASGNVSVHINDVVYECEIINNQVSVPVGMLNAGNYTVTIDYHGDINHYDNSTIYILHIDKHNTTINVNCDDIVFGDDLNITLNINATGKVNVTIENVTYVNEIINNQTTFSIAELNAGNYSVLIEYWGDTNYYSNSTIYDVFIDKRNTVINVNCDDIIFGDRLNITVNVDAVGEVQVEIANITYYATVENNKATLSIADINAGNYTAYVKYMGGSNYYESDSYYNVFVDKRNTTIDVNCDDIVFGQQLDLTLDIKAEGYVNVSIANKTYRAEIINNTAELFIGNLTAGNHTVVINYYESANYYSSNISYGIYVAKKQPVLVVVTSDITYGDNLIVNVTTDAMATGTVKITVGDKTYDAVLSGGFASAAISDVGAGEYTILANYTGDNNFFAVQNTTDVKVAKKATSLSVNTSDITYGDDLVVDITLSEAINDVVTLSVNNVSYEVNLVGGAASKVIKGLNAGTYAIAATFAENANYTGSNASASAVVSRKNTSLTLSASDITYGDDLIVSIELSEAVKGAVSVNVNGKSYNVNLTDGKGQLKVSDLAAGSYPVAASYAGDNNLIGSAANVTVKVNKKATALDIKASDITYGDDLIVNVELSEAINEAVTVSVAGKSYNVQLTNGKGKLTVSNLNGGDYTISASYNGNVNLTGAQYTSDVTVGKANSSISVSVENVLIGEDAVISIVIGANESGKLNVTVSKDGASVFTSTVDISSKEISIPVSGLKVGKYDVTVTYGGDVNYMATTSEDSFEVSPRAAEIIIDAPTVKEGEDAVIAVTIPNATGTVSVEVNDNKYDLPLTDGKASLTLSGLDIGVYDITVSYPGNEVVLPGEKSAELEVEAHSYSYKDLQALIDSTEAGGVLNLVRNYTYNESVDNKTIVISKPITINANGNAVIGLDKAGIFTISASNVVLSDFVLTNANAMRGAAAFITGDNVTIQNTEFVYNYANSGAGVFSEGSGTVIYNSIFMYNKATIGAGVVLNGDNGQVSYSSFIMNNAVVGAGLVIYGDDAIIYASNFLMNDARVGAGAISYGLRTNCDESIFKDNVAYTDYSLQSSSSGTLGASADDALSAVDEENGFGAGLVLYGNSAAVRNSQFIANDAANGAGLVIAAKYCDVSDSVFENNTADTGAGAVVMGEEAVISGSRFFNNTARLGAGIMSNASSTVVDNTTFEKNTAENGAGIMSNGDKLLVTSSTFADNTAVTGAGIVVNSTNANITQSLFTGNDAETGAGIIVKALNTTVSDTSFEDNDALLGTAIFVEREGSLTLEDNNVSSKALTVAYESELSIETTSAEVGQDVTITVTVSSASIYPISGNVVIKVAGNEYRVQVINNTATKVISGLAAGDYEVKADYSGDKNHTASSAVGNFTVSRISNVTITYSVDGAFSHENTVLTFNLPNDAAGTVTVTVNGKKYTGAVKNGVAKITLDELDKGEYVIEMKYSGDTKYADNGYDINLSVASHIVIDAPALVKYYHGPERFAVKVTDFKGSAISGANVTISINGRDYVRVTDDKGVASMAINLNSGKYNVTVSYDDCEVNTTITIKETVSGENVTKMFRNGTQYYATFYDTSGKTLAENTAVEFNINGVFYTRYTNDKGVARMNINLNPGEYIITAKNPNSTEQYTNVITVLPIIVENYDLTKYYKNASQYTLRILDDQGNPVKAGVEVRLNINGVFYTRTSNDDGYVKMNINLNPGEYIITAEYKGLMASNKIKVLPVIETKNLVMKYKDGSKFEAKILDGQGKAYPGQTVTFNVNGVFYDRVTGDDGIARLAINLMAGQYIITSSYNGLNAANKITITS